MEVHGVQWWYVAQPSFERCFFHSTYPSERVPTLISKSVARAVVMIDRNPRAQVYDIFLDGDENAYLRDIDNIVSGHRSRTEEKKATMPTPKSFKTSLQTTMED